MSLAASSITSAQVLANDNVVEEAERIAVAGMSLGSTSNNDSGGSATVNLRGVGGVTEWSSYCRIRHWC